MEECGKELSGTAVVRLPIGPLAAELSSAPVSRQSAPCSSVQRVSNPAAQNRDFGSFHSREHPSRVLSGGADLKRLADRDERPGRGLAGSDRSRTRLSVPRNAATSIVVEIVQVAVAGDACL